jgi:vacuolar-type H+-ATPase subunit E/Vma4
MAIGDILAAIRHETETEIRGVAEEAERRTADVLERARIEAAEVEDREAHARDQAAHKAADRIVNQARLNVDRRMREAREELYAEAQRETAARLAGIRAGPDYRAVLDRLIDESRAVLGAGTVIRVDSADAALVTDLMAGRGDGDRIRVDPSLETAGGIELWADDGRRVTNTLEARLEKAEPHLRSLAGQLVPELRSTPS